MEKNENKIPEMLEILQHCNEEYVPTNADKSRILQKIPLGGDHLTVERAVSAVNAVADADSPYERLHGLVLKHEDFHCEIACSAGVFWVGETLFMFVMLL